MTLVAAIQMASTNNAQTNIASAISWIEKAADQGAKLVALPENFITMALSLKEKLALKEEDNGPFQQQLAACAKKNKVWIVGGTLPLQSIHKNKFYASCLVWNDFGERVARYDKLHLFDVKISKTDEPSPRQSNEALGMHALCMTRVSESGQQHQEPICEEYEEYRESAYIVPGNHIEVISTPFGRIGLGICYDLRFPEFFRLLMLKGIDILVLPSAFTIPTGKAHWQPLLQARAIENLCYVIAPNQVGVRTNGHGTYGHSMIIDPWGEILACKEQNEGIIIAKIDLDYLAKTRQQFPALNHYQPFIMQELTQRGVTT